MAVSTHRCFRYDVLPSYKHNRKDVRRPILLRDLKQHLIDRWGAKSKPRLEADDVLGIWATLPTLRGRKVIVSADKDFKQIPGHFWDPAHSEFPVRISDDAADRWHMMQTLMGDATDGYSGCPGVGPYKAEAMLSGRLRAAPYEHVFKSGPRKGQREVRWTDMGGAAPWETVVSLYAKAGLTEADALQQARVARICRASDYDIEKQEPILWTPPQQ